MKDLCIYLERTCKKILKMMKLFMPFDIDETGKTCKKKYKESIASFFITDGNASVLKPILLSCSCFKK